MRSDARGRMWKQCAVDISQSAVLLEGEESKLFAIYIPASKG